MKNLLVRKFVFIKHTFVFVKLRNNKHGSNTKKESKCQINFLKELGFEIKKKKHKRNSHD